MLIDRIRKIVQENIA